MTESVAKIIIEKLEGIDESILELRGDAGTSILETARAVSSYFLKRSEDINDIPDIEIAGMNAIDFAHYLHFAVNKRNRQILDWIEKFNNVSYEEKTAMTELGDYRQFTHFNLNE